MNQWDITVDEYVAYKERLNRDPVPLPVEFELQDFEVDEPPATGAIWNGQRIWFS